MKTKPMNDADGDFTQEAEEPDIVEDDADDDAADDDEADATDDEETETSLDQILSRRKQTEEDEEEESILDLTPEERLESLTVRAVPKQANEFICSNCRLVKNQSQLADAKRVLCRDCE